MALQFVLGNSGSGKTTYLYKTIVEQATNNPFKNYLIIVPEQFTMQTQRMLVDLSPNHAIMNIDVLSFKRLAYRVFDELGINHIEILEETGKNLVLRKIAQDNAESLSVMRPNIGKIGYISEVKSLLSELVQYNISPDSLEDFVLSEGLPEVLKAKLKDVIVLYRGFEEFMKKKYITAEELLNVLGDVAADSAILRESVLVFDEFTGFTPIQNKLLMKLFKIVSQIYVTITIDHEEDFYHSRGQHELFDMPKKSISSLIRLAEETGIEVLDPIVLEPSADKRYKNSKELFFMEQNLFRKNIGQNNEPCENIGIMNLKNPKEEVIWAAREINELIHNDGYRYKDIAIVTGDVASYSNYVENYFRQYNIPFFLDTTKEILFHPFIEFIRATLEVFLYDFSCESVLRFLRCGFCNIEDRQIDILENYLLATGIKGKNAWSKRWLRVPRDNKNYDLPELEELRIRIFDILSPVVTVFRDSNSTVSDQIICLYKMIEGLGLERQLWLLEEEYLSRGNQVKSKEYGQIYKIVMSLFEKYISILGDERLSISEFVEILDAGFDAAELATIPPGFDCVTIGDIERTRLNDVKILFFLGVNDGIIPKTVNNGGIISQYERQMLKDLDIELAPGAREQSFIQKYYLYLNMTKPSDKLYMTYHRLDNDGKSALKSYLINTICRLFTNIEIQCIDDISKILNVSTENAAKDYLINGEQDDNWYALAKWFGADDILDARFRLYEGNPISEVVAQSVYGRKIKGSVTRLEQFARCQYSHYLKYGLLLRERENSGVANVDIGNIYHDALNRYSVKLQKSDKYNWRNIDDDMRESFAKEAFDEAIEVYPNLLAYATASEKHMLNRMETVFMQTVWALTVQVKKGKFDPDKYEFEFQIANDDNLSLYGRIDRIDKYNEEGKSYIKVIDYKSGNAKFDLIKLYQGVSLQLAVYMNAAMEEGDIPGGMLYYHIDDPVIEISDELEKNELEEAVLLCLRPDGLINDDEEVIRAFDENLEKKSLVVPVSLKKNGQPDAYSSVASREDFDLIREYTNNKISELGHDILSGQIKVNPLMTDGVDSCRYCSFQSVCSINSKLPGIEARKEAKLKKADIIEMMSTENAKYNARKGD